MDKPKEYSEIVYLAIKAWGWKYVLEQIAYAYEYAGENIHTKHPEFYNGIAMHIYQIRNDYEKISKEMKF